MFMSSGHWQNTGLARWVSKNLYNYNTNNEKSMNPMKWHLLQNDGDINSVRDSINGFPCRLILVNDGDSPLNEGQQEPTPGNTKDMGIFNFNNDKDNVTSLGLDTEIFPNALSYEVTANSDTSAGAFVPYQREYTVTTTSSATWGQTGDIPLSSLGISVGTINIGYVGTSQGRYEIKNSSQSTIQAEYGNDGEVKEIEITSEATYIKFIFGSDSYFTVGNIKLSPNRTGISGTTLMESNDITELTYLQNSFELRYPDSDDVGSDYGYLGMPVNAYHFRTALFGGARVTSDIPVSFFDADELILEDTDFSNGTINIYVDDVKQQVGAWQLTNEPYTIDISSAEKIKFEPYGNTNWTYLQLNGVKYFADNIHDPYDTNLYEPHIKEQFSTDYGLKRVIDWVGNCTDEEFVAHYEEYFNKHYLLRYYLLVITLG